ncbi:MAG: NADH dehydrogenase (quinone) subunit G [Zetaproteobacteria bacterium]|nr:MAG: NADH dehydrogenase (quinone) subunit G [Zetaproteobacteria bacterium]
MTTLFIDGREVEVKPGTSVLEACRQHGIDVPYFCYHPELSVAANCRMCLVEIEGWNKPAASCCTPVQEGMKVTTQSPSLAEDRRMVMEYLLINHPLDCPVCDQGGACKLQDYAVAFGASRGRYGEEKRTAVNYDLGPFVVTCMTRCIHCTRCVRFADEIAGTCDIGVLGRGDRMHITGIVEECLESELSGNLPDVCPVGALLDKPSHDVSRPWEMTRHRSACIQCPQGCDISIESRDGVVMRIRPQEGGIEPWICDRGRYVYDAFASDARILQPAVRRDGRLERCGWDEAVEAAAAHLDGKRVGVIFSPDWSVEGLTSIRLLIEAALPGARCGFDLHRRDMRPFAFSEGFAMTSDQLEAADQVVVLGSDLRQRLPLVMQRLRKRLRHGRPVVRIGAMHYRTDCRLTTDLLVRPRDWHAVIATAMEQVRNVGKEAAGMEAWLAAVEGRHEAGKALADALIADSCALLVGEEIRSHRDAAALIHGLDLLMRACGHAEPERDGRNLIPPGMNAQPLELLFGDRRESVGALLEAAGKGEIDTIVLIGSDPAGDGLFPAEFRQAAEGSATLIQIAAIEGQCSADVDIQLPCHCYAEVDGTFVNMAGRLRTSDLPLTPPKGEGRPLWKVMMRLVQALGGEVPVVSLDELRRACMERVPGVERAWDGSPRDQWLMAPARHREAAHLPAQQARLMPLDVVSRYSMYREGSWARASGLLVTAGKLHALADLIVHPKTLQEAGFTPGDKVTVKSHRGSHSYHIGVRGDLSEGVLFVARRGVAGVLSSECEAELAAPEADG